MKPTAAPALFTHKDFQILHQRFKSPVTSYAISGSYPVSIFFCTKGPKITVSPGGENISFLSYKKANFLYRGGIAAKLTWENSASVEFIEIRLSKELMIELSACKEAQWESVFHLAKIKKCFVGENTWPLQSGILEAIHDMVYLSRQPIHYQDLLFKAKLMETAAIFFSQMRIAQEPVPISDEHAKFALKAQQYIHKIKGKKDFTIIGLAQQLGTNETYLKQAFKAMFGKSMFRYFQERNMQQAKEALQSGQAVHVIAKQLGYSSVSHFSHAFKEEFGVPPSRYQ